MSGMEELVKQIRELSLQGLSDSEIGRRLGLSRGKVRYIRRKYGIEKPKREAISDEYILQLYKSGMSCNQIAREIGVNPSTVSYRLKRILGVTDLDYRRQAVEAVLKLLPRPLAYKIDAKPRKFYGMTIGEAVRAIDVLEKIIYGDLGVVVDPENLRVLKKLRDMLVKMLEKKRHYHRLVEAVSPTREDEGGEREESGLD